MLVSVLRVGHVWTTSTTPPGTDHHWDYVVIGAGPAGLQLGHHLQAAGRSYVIMEKGNTSGKKCVWVCGCHGEVVMERGNTSGKAVCIGLRSSWRGATPQVSHVYRAEVVMERGNTSGKPCV